MTTVQTKLYPSEQHSQLTEHDDVDAGQAANYVLNIIKMATARSDAGPVRLRGWQGISLHQERTLTPLEDAQAKLEAIRQALLGAGREPMSPEAVASILLQLQ